jgi:general secretion pathway protein B
MSFILDALKKSETDRQQKAGAEFSGVPSGSGDSQSFRWLWILAFLLLVNIVVLIGILMRPDKAPDVSEDTLEVPAAQAKLTEPSFEQKIAAAKENQPVPTETASVDPQSQVRQGAARPVVAPARERVLTIDEVRVNGTLQIADLHLDIHVYSDDPEERFVFINMVKHRERSQLEEGPVVTEITPDGVILEHQGTTFLLPRE